MVEVIYGERTADADGRRPCSPSCEFVGKTPVYVRKDVPGFIGNRLLHALQKDAMAVVASGVASAADVDLWSPRASGVAARCSGPLAVCDLAGPRPRPRRGQLPVRDLDRSPDRRRCSFSLVQEGKIGVKSLQGFHAWTEEDVRETIARRDAALIRALQVDRHEKASQASGVALAAGLQS